MTKHHKPAGKSKRGRKRDYVYRNGICFEKTPAGLIFCPQYRAHPRKHNCPDCMQCGLCSDPRCAVCRSESPLTPR